MNTRTRDASQPRDWARSQRAWMDALLKPSPTPPWASWQGGVRHVEAAGAIYINNVRANVISALSLSYPAVRQALGPQRFASLVVEGLHRAPPTCGDLSGYGGWLPQLLSEHLKRERLEPGCTAPSQRSDADDLVWLARLEWALDQVRSQDSEPAWTWADATRDLAQPDWMAAHTRLRQPWRFWPLTDTRATLLTRLAAHLQAEWLPTDASAPTCSPTCSATDAPLTNAAPVALLQQGGRLLPVQAEELAWLQALNADSSIESATQQVLASHPTWRPDTIVQLCLSHGLLCPLRHAESQR